MKSCKQRCKRRPRGRSEQQEREAWPRAGSRSRSGGERMPANKRECEDANSNAWCSFQGLLARVPLTASGIVIMRVRGRMCLGIAARLSHVVYSVSGLALFRRIGAYSATGKIVNRKMTRGATQRDGDLRLLFGTPWRCAGGLAASRQFMPDAAPLCDFGIRQTRFHLSLAAVELKAEPSIFSAVFTPWAFFT